MKMFSRLIRAVRRGPVHPLFFSLYPVLALLANNAFEIRLADAVRALTWTSVSALGLFAVVYLFRQQLDTAGAVTSLMVTAFFSYGHLYDWGRQLSPAALEVVRHRYLLPVFVMIVAVGILFLWRRVELAKAGTPALNLASIMLFIVPTVTLIRAEVEFQRASRRTAEPLESCRLQLPPDQYPRDLYYIVLDGYARNDVLAKDYGFDNSSFIEALEARNFYVADASQSNYASTGLSLASSLNMSYLSLEEGATRSGDPTDHWPSLSRSEVRENLACLGYSVVAFDSGYYWTGWRDADVFLSPSEGRRGKMVKAGLNAFEALLLNTTLFRATIDAAIRLPEILAPDIGGPLEEHRQRILFAFDMLQGPASGLPSPKFVFAHIVAPHRPFVFGPEGQPRGSNELFTFDDIAQERDVPESVAYPEQVQYVNRRVLRAVDGILESYPAGHEPLIVLQADHGPSSSRAGRVRILNAYYLPAGGEDLLYDTISPVNSFRLIFQYYFGADYELLPDVSCFSTYDALYDFIVIPNPHATGQAVNNPQALCG